MRGWRLLLPLSVIGWGTSVAGWATVAALHRRKGAAPQPRPVRVVEVSRYVALPPVVAEVDGRRITAEELLGRLLRCYGRATLDRLIRNALIARLAEREGVKVSDREVEAELRRKMREAAKSGLTWNQWLRAKNLSEQDLRRDIKYDLLLRKVAGRHTKVSEKELRLYYDTYKYDFGGRVEVHAQHIFVKTEREARRLLERVRRGEDFAELARRFSRDEATRDLGGDLGWLKRGVLAPELRGLEDAIFSLQPGEMGIAKSRFGWHVVRVLERRGGKILPFEKVRERVREEVYRAKRELVEAEMLDLEKRRARIKILLRFEPSLKK